MSKWTCEGGELFEDGQYRAAVVGHSEKIAALLNCAEAEREKLAEAQKLLERAERTLSVLPVRDDFTADIRAFLAEKPDEPPTKDQPHKIRTAILCIQSRVADLEADMHRVKCTLQEHKL